MLMLCAVCIGYRFQICVAPNVTDHIIGAVDISFLSIVLQSYRLQIHGWLCSSRFLEFRHQMEKGDKIYLKWKCKIERRSNKEIRGYWYSLWMLSVWCGGWYLSEMLHGWFRLSDPFSIYVLANDYVTALWLCAVDISATRKKNWGMNTKARRRLDVWLFISTTTITIYAATTSVLRLRRNARPPRSGQPALMIVQKIALRSSQQPSDIRPVLTPRCRHSMW